MNGQIPEVPSINVKNQTPFANKIGSDHLIASSDFNWNAPDHSSNVST